MLRKGRVDGNIDFVIKSFDEMNKLCQYTDVSEREKTIIL
jgi:hypothetical protein